MAEEIKTTSAGDSVPDKSVVGSSSQGEKQDTQGVEERKTEADGAIVPDVKMVDENGIDAKPANMSDDGKMKKEMEVKTAASVEPGTGEVAEEEGKGEDESQAEEKEEIDAKKADEEDSPTEDKSEVSSAKETQAEKSLDEAEAEDKEKNGKEERQEVIEEKAGGEVEEKAEETVEAEGNEEENVEGKAEEGLSEVEATNQSESEEKEIAGDGGEEENSEIKTEENLAKEGDEKEEEEGDEAVVGVEPSLVSSEELADKNGEGIADEEWISWKSEFVNKFNKRFDSKWIISGIGIVVLIVGLVIFFGVPGLRSPNSGEVKSLKEIAGPVYDMKFFLPLAGVSGKTRFVKVTVAIELMDKGFRKEIDKKISDLREEVINLVLTKSPKEVRSSHGKEMLKKAITNSLNKHLSKNCIKTTYFTELVVL